MLGSSSVAFGKVVLMGFLGVLLVVGQGAEELGWDFVRECQAEGRENHCGLAQTGSLSVKPESDVLAVRDGSKDADSVGDCEIGA